MHAMPVCRTHDYADGGQFPLKGHKVRAHQTVAQHYPEVKQIVEKEVIIRCSGKP
jgi:hypothetical protein